MSGLNFYGLFYMLQRHNYFAHLGIPCNYSSRNGFNNRTQIDTPFNNIVMYFKLYRFRNYKCFIKSALIYPIDKHTQSM